MNARINQLVKSLLQKESLEQCSLNELQQFAERHPYFGAAQLLLTKKLQAEKSDLYEQQLQKTYLFFHNPLWVEQLLNDSGAATVKSAPEKEEPATAAIIAEQMPAYTGPAPETASLPELQAVIEPAKAIPETIPVAENDIQPIVTEQIADKAASSPLANMINPALLDTEEDPLTDLPPFEMEKPGAATGTANEPVFEPFHTVDYFASQGVRFKEDERPKDKLGIQLKSFTDWLKTMKRLPQAEVIKNAESPIEHKVDQLAENSLKEREIVTETMAEVWEKQGNSAKAIDIYSKLSLLEPAKSTYFAAKIEDLKKLN